MRRILTIFLCLFFVFPIFLLAQAPSFTIQDFMGTNLRRQDPIKYLDCVGFVREYHDWAIDEGDIFNTNPSPSENYPDNIYKWNPGYQSQAYQNFDQFYPDIYGFLDNSSSSAFPICANMKFCLPRIAGGNAKNAFYPEFKPVLTNLSIPHNVHPVTGGNSGSIPLVKPLPSGHKDLGRICSGSGAITVSNLKDETNYVVKFMVNGHVVSSITQISVDEKITIENLPGGHYSGFMLGEEQTAGNSDFCYGEAFDLSLSPSSAEQIESVEITKEPEVDPDDPTLFDGKIDIEVPSFNKDYVISYTFNNTPIQPFKRNSGANRIITIDNLKPGNYSDIIVRSKNSDDELCISEAGEKKHLKGETDDSSNPNYPFLTPDYQISNVIQPTGNCFTTSDGAIELEGFVVGEIYEVSYFINGEEVPKYLVGPLASDKIVLQGLGSGNYTRIMIGQDGFFGESLSEFLQSMGSPSYTLDDISRINSECDEETHNTVSPCAYEHFADWVNQFSRAYGPLGNPPNKEDDSQAPAPDSRTQQIGYIEIWNEQDKNWFDTQFSSSSTNMIKFSPEEYAAMASAAYDGHVNKVKGDMPDNPDSYFLGVNGLQFAFGGLFEIDDEQMDFVDAAVDWCESNRSDGENPFDVFNFHHYCDKNSQGLGNVGVSPEADYMTDNQFTPQIVMSGDSSGVDANDEPLKVTFKMQLRTVRKRIKDRFPNAELWLSEFGYDTNENSPQRVEAINAFNRTADAEEVQGRFLLRSFLDIAAAGWDRAIQFCIRDEDSEATKAGLYQSSGLVKDVANNHAPKKSYYYTSTMHEILADYKFCQELNAFPQSASLSSDNYDVKLKYNIDKDMPRAYLFNNDGSRCSHADYPSIQPGNIIAMWLPTSENRLLPEPAAGNFEYRIVTNKLIGRKALVYIPTVGDLNGIKRTIDVVQLVPPSGTTYNLVFPASLPISEKPFFVELLPPDDDDIACDPTLVCPRVDPMNSRGISCDAIELTIVDRATMGTIYGASNMDCVGRNFPAGMIPPKDFDYFRIYYYDKNDSEETGPPVFNISDTHWKLYQDKYLGTKTSIIVSGLDKPLDNYFFVIEGIIDRPDIGIYWSSNMTPVCVSSAVSTTSCFGGVDPATIRGINSGNSVVQSLFDYESVNVCYPTATVPSDSWEGVNGPVEINLVSNNMDMTLHSISLLDGTSEGEMLIEFELDGTVLHSINYTTTLYGEWVPFPLCLSDKVDLIRFSNVPGQNLPLDPRIIHLRLHGFWGADFASGNCCGVTGSGISGNVSDLINMGLASDFNNTTQNIFVSGELVIDQNYGFSNQSVVFMDEGASIIVNPGVIFNVSEESVIQGCETMWEGISLSRRGRLSIDESTVRDAYQAVRVLRGSSISNFFDRTTFFLNDSRFQQNMYGLYVEPNPTLGDISWNSSVRGCTFDGLGADLKPQYTGQPVWWQVPHSGIFLNSTPFIQVTSSATEESVFSNMLNGIYLIGSNLDVKDVKFNNLKAGDFPSSFNPTKKIGGFGINASGGQLYQSGFGNHVTSAFSFQKVDYPIDLNRMRFEVTENNMFEIKRGIRSSLSRRNTAFQNANLITNNRMLPTQNGIELFLNEPGILVYKNDIRTPISNTTFGISATGGFTTTEDPTVQVYDIRENIVEVRSNKEQTDRFGAGIYLNGVHNANVEGNNIMVNNYDLIDLDPKDGGAVPAEPFVYGILQQNSSGNSICSDTITGQDYRVGRGLFSEFSNLYTISCNRINNIRTGLGFRLTSESASGAPVNGVWEKGILGNTMQTSLYGMYLQNIGDPAETGKQDRTGNRWEGPFISSDPTGSLAPFAANYESPTNPQRSEFVVNQGAGNVIAPTNIEPDDVDWFTYEDNSTRFQCSEESSLCANNNFFNPQTDYLAISTGEIEWSEYSEPVEFMKKRQVFKAVKDHYGETVSHPGFAAFISDMTGTSVEAFYNVDKSASELFVTAPQLRTQIATLDDAIDSIIVEDRLAYEAFMELPVNEIMDQIQTGTAPQFFEGLTNLTDDRSAAMEQLNVFITNQILNAKNLNNSVVAVKPFEQKEQEINGLFLDAIDIQQGLSVTEEAFLSIESIADLCPQNYGVAVYKARGLYTALTGGGKIVWESCYSEITIGEEGSESGRYINSGSSSEIFDINVFPNPASEVIYIDVKGQGFESATCELYSVQGKLLKSKNFSRNINRLSTEGLNAGIYIVKVINDKGEMISKKVSILK